jgi:hypothetical protein
MNKLLLFFIMTLLPLELGAVGSSIKVEYDNTSLTIELKDNPRIINQGENIVLVSDSQSVTLFFPCKVTFQGSSGNNSNGIISIRNNGKTPLEVYTLDGRKIVSLTDKSELFSLKSGIYIVNGKKIIIK